MDYDHSIIVKFSDYKTNKTNINYRNNKSMCRRNTKSKNMLGPGETFIRNLQRKVQSTTIETIQILSKTYSISVLSRSAIVNEDRHYIIQKQSTKKKSINS